MATSDQPEVHIAASSGASDRLEFARRKQQVIMEVLGACEGQGEVQVRHALLRALPAHGLPTPIDPWLDAVAAELAAGRVYVVSADLDMSDFGVDASEPPPSMLT